MGSGGWGGAGRSDPVPDAHLVAWHGFGDGRHVWNRSHAFRRGDAQRAHLACLDVSDRTGNVIEHHLHLTGEQVGERGGRAAVRQRYAPRGSTKLYGADHNALATARNSLIAPYHAQWYCPPLFWTLSGTPEPMPKPRAARLETPTARRRLAPRKKPYWLIVSPNIALGYRRNRGTGTWNV